MHDFNGIDVSRWQGNIDWSKVYMDGIKYAILKLGGSDDGVYKDKTFEQNYAQAKSAGLKIGVYWFVGSQFFTPEDGIREAEACIEKLNGKLLDFPIYVDIEAPATGNKAGITSAALTFCGVIHDKYNLPVGVYGSDISGFKDRMDYQAFLQYPYISLWVARYGSAPKWATKYDIWQSTSSGSVNGIAGRVDTDVFTDDFIARYLGTAVAEAPKPVEPSHEILTGEKALAHAMYELIKPYL